MAEQNIDPNDPAQVQVYLMDQINRTNTRLETTLAQFNNRYGQQDINVVVAPFSGEQTKFNEWINSLEKFSKINNLDDNNQIAIAYLTARGPVSEYCSRWTEENANVRATWTAMKSALTKNFSPVTDSEHAHALLRKIKQYPQERVRCFAERIYLLAKDAFPEVTEGEEDAAQRVAERQLVSYFTDGLNDRAVKMKIMRASPASMKEAVEIARKEINLMERFDLRNPRSSTSRMTDERREIPMEVDHVRPRSCGICGRTGHSAKFCRERQARNPEGRRMQGRPGERRDVHNIEPQNVNARGQRLCYFCNSPNHLKHQCQYIEPQNADARGQRLCYFCGSPNHFKRQCELFIRTMNNRPRQRMGQEKN